MPRSLTAGRAALGTAASTMLALALTAALPGQAQAEYRAMSVPITSDAGGVTGQVGHRCSGSTDHSGIDISADTGDPVHAAYSGTVQRLTHSSYGNYVVITHTAGYTTLYAHLSGYASAVPSGTKVSKGQVIGYAGSTGNSTGPHLHFEVRLNGVSQSGVNSSFPCGSLTRAGDPINWAFPGLPSGSSPILGASAPFDWNGDSHGDVIARKPDGTLWLYPGDGDSGFLSPRPQIGTGFDVMETVVSPGDFDGDKNDDLIGLLPDGDLKLFRGDGHGGFRGSYDVVGTGFGSMTALLAPGNMDGKLGPDLLARKSDGSLWLYPGNGQGGFTGDYRQVASGFGSMTGFIAPGDFSGDGKPDLIARKPDGTLWLYPGSGAGGFSGTYTQIGTGFGGATALLGPGNFDGSKGVDIAARMDDGALKLFPGTGTGHFVGPYPTIGTGFQIFDLML